MTYVVLALCCALLSYGTVNGVVSWGVAFVWELAGRGRGRALESAPALFLLRMLPAATSFLFVTFFFFPGFLRLEPRDTTETVGPLMLAGALVSALLLLWGGARSALCWLATVRLLKTWTSKGERIEVPGAPAPTYCIDSDFPVISLAGIVRPRLFLSRKVLSACTPGELSAVLAHEGVHRARGDNLKRWLLCSSPDFLSLTSMAGRMERRWCEASELAADDSAAGTDLGFRADLAAALVKVARLAAGRPFPCNLSASAFHLGGNIGRRVERLMREPPSTHSRRGGTGWRVGTAATVLVLFSLAWQPKVQEQVHRVTETVVRLLQ